MNIFDRSDAMYKNDTFGPRVLSWFHGNCPTFPGAAGPQNRGDDPSCGLSFFLFFFFGHIDLRGFKSLEVMEVCFMELFLKSKTPKMMSLRNKDFGVSWNMMEKFCFFRWKKDCKS